MTIGAENNPELVPPYAQVLASLLEHPKTRVHWEVVQVAHLLPELREEVHNLAEGYPDHKKGVVRKASKRVLKGS